MVLRSWRGLLVVSTLALSWLAMQAVHELGHVAHCWLSGGSVARITLHPLELSRTELGVNPHPLFVAWGGAMGGVAIPLLLLAIAHRAGSVARIPARFFAGFCLLANGIYLGAGAFVLAGDAGDLVLHGSPPWSLVAFGLLCAPLGLLAWNGLGRQLELAGAPAERRLALGTSLGLVALVLGELLATSAATWPAGLTWGAAVVAVLGLVLVNVEGSEVQHVVFAVQALAFLGAGALLALGARAVGGPAWVTFAAFLAPAALRHLRGRRRRRRERSAAIDEPRLRGLGTAELIAETGRSPHAAALTDLVLERPDAREALLQAVACGSPPERRGAVEVAVFARSTDRALALAVARVVLEAPAAAREDRARALVAVWDAADAPLLERLRATAFDEPELRCAALEVRARSGDPTVLEDWLADATLDAGETAGRLALVLGPASRIRARLETLRAQHAEGTRERAQLEALAGALELFAP